MTIIPTRNFNDNVEYYLRKKKYKKIFSDIKTVTDELERGNLVGVRLEDIHLSENTAVYKVRIANSRLIYYVVIDEKIYLLAIYAKKDDIRVVSEQQIEQHIKILVEAEPPKEA